MTNDSINEFDEQAKRTQHMRECYKDLKSIITSANLLIHQLTVPSSMVKGVPGYLFRGSNPSADKGSYTERLTYIKNTLPETTKTLIKAVEKCAKHGDTITWETVQRVSGNLPNTDISLDENVTEKNLSQAINAALKININNEILGEATKAMDQLKTQLETLNIQSVIRDKLGRLNYNTIFYNDNTRSVATTARLLQNLISPGSTEERLQQLKDTNTTIDKQGKELAIQAFTEVWLEESKKPLEQALHSIPDSLKSSLGSRNDTNMTLENLVDGDRPKIFLRVSEKRDKVMEKLERINEIVGHKTGAFKEADIEKEPLQIPTQTEQGNRQHTDSISNQQKLPAYGVYINPEQLDHLKQFVERCPTITSDIALTDFIQTQFERAK